MKKILTRLLMLAIVCVSLVFGDLIQVHAAEENVKEVYFCILHNNVNTDETEIYHNFYYRLTVEEDTRVGLCLMDYIGANEANYATQIKSDKNFDYKGYSCTLQEYYANPSMNAESSWSDTTFISRLFTGYGYWRYGEWTDPSRYGDRYQIFAEKCDIPIFLTEQELNNYIATGDTTGQINKETNYDVDHDFSQDTYNSDIPVPQLSHLSYTGFHVDNADSTRDLEVYVKTNFYGVSHLKKSVSLTGTIGDFSVNKSWVYASHRFNFLTSDVAYYDADFDIEEKYGVNLVDTLISDFQNWSIEYSSRRKLPDYSFFEYSSGMYDSIYNSVHLYSDQEDSITQLKQSSQASVTYYVRFCALVNGAYDYGRWMAYSYGVTTDTTVLDQKENVSIGDVEYDPNTGEPIIKNPVDGTQGDDGTFQKNDYSGSAQFDASDLWATIQSLISGMGQIPSLISTVLEFLPSWLLAMIAAGIAAIVVLRFVGR